MHLFTTLESSDRKRFLFNFLQSEEAQNGFFKSPISILVMSLVVRKVVIEGTACTQ